MSKSTQPSRLLVLLAGCTICVAAQPPPSVEPQWMDITVERQTNDGKQGTAWKAIDPALVLNQGDLIRFKFRSNFDGYLYVTNRGSGGKVVLLFPREETGQANRVRVAQDYLIPATQSHFRIAGPAGYDSVFWLVSPVALANSAVLPETMPTPETLPKNAQPSQPAKLRPRCDPTQMRSRGLCLDNDAGPRNVQDPAQAPGAIATTPDLKPRELTIIQSKDKTRLSTGGSLGGPVVYEFRLAHK